MEAFLISTGVVAIAEIGDKTQLLAILLAARFRRPAAIGAGILLATIANHAAAAWVGRSAGAWLQGPALPLILAAAFAAMAVWALVPDKDDDLTARAGRFGAFAATAVSFFLVEMGDKTQIATIALAARYQDVLIVASGTTLGMMAANIPAVLLGDRLLAKAPLRLVRFAAAAIFAALAVITLIGVLLNAR